MIIKPQEGPQTAFLSSSADIVVFGGAAGGGKAICIKTEICQPFGWTLLQDLKVGDVVFDENGKTCNVTKVFDIIEKPVSYRLTFDDKTTIDCCEDHQWFTYDAAQLARLTRQDEEWRARRRAKRPSRAKGNKSQAFVDSITARNNAKKETIKPLACGSVKTTKEIVETLKVRNNTRANHAIPVSLCLDLIAEDLPIEPYVLGAWLGDGSKCSGQLTSIDPQIWEEIEKYGYEITHYDRYVVHNIVGLAKKLRIAGLKNNKHIPNIYLRASREQRLALLQGLMDTDGTVNQNGTCEFTNTNYAIAEGCLDLINGLGWKANIREGRAKLYGKDCGPKYTIKWTPDDYVFRLERKRSKQVLATRRTTKFRYIVSAERIEPVPMRCIEVDSPSHLFLAGRQMVPTHNSFAILLDALRHISNPNYGAVIFRRESPQITNTGGLWDESLKLYPAAGGKGTEMKWRFPSGATVKFGHMQHEKDKMKFDGSQIPYIGFDELIHFTRTQFLYMLSRNRSACGVKPCIRATTNPSSESWVAEFIAWWINQDTGYAIPERSGIVRWFVNISDNIYWAETKEECYEKYLPLVDNPKFFHPKSFTFIRSTLDDNKILQEIDPGYVANLLAMPEVERERLLHGNWKISAGEGIIKSEWIRYYDILPPVQYYIWTWDTAQKEGQENDFSAGQYWAVCADGFYLVKRIKIKIEYPKLKRLVWQSFQDYPAKECLIEDKSSGTQLIQDFKRVPPEFADRPNLKPMIVIAMMPGKNMGKDKTERGNFASSAFEGGRVFLPKPEIPGNEWVKETVLEWVKFPNGLHDDEFDAMTQFLARMMRGGQDFQFTDAIQISSNGIAEYANTPPEDREATFDFNSSGGDTLW